MPKHLVVSMRLREELSEDQLDSKFQEEIQYENEKAAVRSFEAKFQNGLSLKGGRV